ncbi:cytochrome c [Pseudomonas sp. R5(2019)]|uniref:cytochrome c n=1 Tax=Pseudomonas sp. R5(2019) TaxID=2697566 RepID=UPI001412E74C|nr:cytochrome c [Pseudomonas sp. R5(2019)]NBA93919.1 c-type cytochrome [Pseudomonas sp. R5(2019)]
MRLCFALLAALCGAPVLAAQLTLDLGHGNKTWQTSALLKHPQAQTLTIYHDVSYKRTMRYRAVPMAALLEGVSPDDHLQGVASDGFAAEMPAGPLLNSGPARAWLAIEDPAHPWPALGLSKASAGPFYLVWTDPQAGNISAEQWPYRLASIRRLAPVAERFPKMRPDPTLAADDPINQGFALFQKNCMACHRLNGAGDAQMGPDLNIPHSPTEYLSGDFLRYFIRDPQSLRQWPQAKMPGFDRQALPDADLDLLIGYLKHMAARRP